MKTTRQTMLFEIYAAYPEALEIFERHVMSCSGCMKVMKENLEIACIRHEKDLEALEETCGTA